MLWYQEQRASLVYDYLLSAFKMLPKNQDFSTGLKA